MYYPPRTGKPDHSLRLLHLPALASRLSLLAAVACLGGALASGVRADTPVALPENKIVPTFTLKDADGASHALTEYRGRPVVVCFACGCRWCHEFGLEWAQMQKSGVLPDAATPADPAAPAPAKPPITLVVYMGDAAGVRAYAQSAGLDLTQTVLLADPNLKVTQQYHAMPCPRLYVLDGNGLLRYVNSHADDKPQQAAATVLVNKTIDGLRRTTLPPPPTPSTPTKKPAPKTGKGGKNAKR